MAADANAPVKLGAIGAAVELYNAGQIDDKFERLANGMVCMGSKPNLEAIQAVENPKVGWFFNALDTDINYAYVEEEKLVKTEDVELDAEKTYYTSEGEEVAEPDVANIAEYYEYKFVGRWDKVGGVFQLPAYLDNSALETWIAGKNFATVSQLPSEQASNVQALQQKFAAFATLTNMVEREDVTVYELYDLIYEIATKLGYEPPAAEPGE